MSFIFWKLGTDNNYVHFLVQSIPKLSTTRIITIVKRIIARKVFDQHPEVKKNLWGGAFWIDGYFVNTMSKFGDEKSIFKYVRDQGIENRI